MDPIVQVLIHRIEALAVDKAGLKGQNLRLVNGLKVISLSLYDTHESLVGKIEEVLRHLQLTSSDEGEK